MTHPPQPEAADAVEVLIVEDDALNVRLLEQVCRSAGYRTRVARDGVEGLEAVEAKIPDLMLLDVMMPRLDGYGVLERLRARAEWVNIPVVMVTAVQNDDARTRCIDLGADDYVTKPFRIAELRDRMRSTLEMSRFKMSLLG
ncbi:MAG: response regulator [Myxococcales bacterium]|nr:response regulator [Myxococcales bacterium]MCB9523455.1 response regulator [Myxococcales bacterium]